ncbi:MAG: hypothetical protein R6W77_08300 [Trueperaceae bacterium]
MKRSIVSGRIVNPPTSNRTLVAHSTTARNLSTLALGLACASFVLAACASAQPDPTPYESPTLSSCPLFPPDHIWNTPITTAPLDPKSTAFVASIGATRTMHPDFGSGLWDGGLIGIPYTIVGAGQQRVDVSFYYPTESDPGPYPIPPDTPVEGAPPGGTASGGDRHVIVVDTGECVLYELFDAERQPNGSWQAGSGAIFDLNGYALRPDGWTSADAAGLPILPGLVRYEEVAAGAIHHALRFTAPITSNVHVWPARHDASSETGAAYPPMGQRFRLRADFDASGFSPEAQVIVQALQTYGMILADNGSAWYLSGAPDERWDNDALRDLKEIRGEDFEAVDVSGWMVDADSGLAAP